MSSIIGGKEIAVYIEKLSKGPYAFSIRKSIETRDSKQFSKICASAGIPKKAIKRLLRTFNSSSEPEPMAWYF